MAALLKKILVWAVLLTLLLTLYTLWKVQRTEQQILDFVATELIPADTTSGATLGGVDIDALGGTIVLRDLTWYTARDTALVSAGQIRVDVGTFKSLQMGLLPAAYVLASLSAADVEASTITVHYDGGQISMLGLAWSVTGRLGQELQHSITARQVETRLLPETLGNTGGTLRLFGVDTSNLTFASITLEGITSQEEYRLQSGQILHRGFRARFEGEARIPADDSPLSDLQVRGSLVLDQLSDQVRTTAESVATLLGFAVVPGSESLEIPLNWDGSRISGN